jgi:hypothetical protein
MEFFLINVLIDSKSAFTQNLIMKTYSRIPSIPASTAALIVPE